MSEPKSGGCRNTLAYAFAGGVLIGFIGFIAGFVGPIVFTPDANQGPLLGIFITGPGGFILGAMAGAIWAQFRKKKR